MNLATIKPLDEEAIWKMAQQTGALVTVEEHQIAGGMGSAVAECVAQHQPVPIEFVGVRDQFGQSGTPEELLEQYHLGESHIKDAVARVLLRKSA
jgi:transketolase